MRNTPPPSLHPTLGITASRQATNLIVVRKNSLNWEIESCIESGNPILTTHETRSELVVGNLSVTEKFHSVEENNTMQLYLVIRFRSCLGMFYCPLVFAEFIFPCLQKCKFKIWSHPVYHVLATDASKQLKLYHIMGTLYFKWSVCYSSLPGIVCSVFSSAIILKISVGICYFFTILSANISEWQESTLKISRILPRILLF